jgi:TolB-like protein/Tfp pilus assembly protein PilF/tRNA A-37 threonylcarbamoyl transferase component Bud32
MTDPHLTALADALAGRYVIEREIGRGSAAVVYLAQDIRHGRRVALKVLHAELGAALGVERFLREIRTQARLQHPHVLPLFDSGSAAGRLFCTMPYIEGGSLRDLLRRRGQLPVETVAQLATEVSSALTYAHALGVVHRDIKPENILVSETGHALLTDFGIAYAIEDGGGHGGRAKRITESGITLGTPAYMSPEQSVGDETVDSRSDIYSLAVVVYEMLAGSPPFTGANPRAIMARRLVEPPPSLAVVRPGLPPTMELAITRALARSPAERFDTAADFAVTLCGRGEEPPEPQSESPAPAPARSRRRQLVGAALAIPLLVGVVVVAQRALRGGDPQPVTAAGRQMLVVLPFRNLGDTADAYFADGLTEELTSRLAGLGELRVISRTSAEQYRESPLPLKEIGAELGAGYVLEGSVHLDRGAGGVDRVRVRPRLISVADDSQLWSEPYEVELTEVFRVQSDIAERVSRALDLALRAPEREALAASGTRDPVAYDFYLRGNDYLGRSNQHADLASAASLFTQAVEADPGFAAAWARLARCHTQIYWHYYDRTAGRLALAEAALDSAIRLGPNLPETHAAKGFYRYWGFLDYEGAIREFEAALRLRPSASEMLQAIGYVERRRGRWEESLGRFVEALRYDPRSGQRAFDVGDNYLSLHMFPEADHYLERAMTLSPDWANPYIYRAWLHVIWRGDLARARALIAEGLTRIEPGRFAVGLQTGDRMSASLVTADSSFWPMLDGLSPGTFAGDTVRYHLLKAEAAAFRRRATAERAHGDSARALLEVRVRRLPDDAKLLATLGLAYMHLGRHADAIRAAERAAELLPVEEDAVSGPFVLAYLARVYTTAGRHDEATGVLERLMGMRSWITPAELRADRIWDPLRRHEGFRRLAGERNSQAVSSRAQRGISPVGTGAIPRQDPSLRSG